MGITAGTAILVPRLYGSGAQGAVGLNGPVTVTVGGSAASISGLTVEVFTGASWVRLAALGAADTAEPTLALEQVQRSLFQLRIELQLLICPLRLSCSPPRARPQWWRRTPTSATGAFKMSPIRFVSFTRSLPRAIDGSMQ